MTTHEVPIDVQVATPAERDAVGAILTLAFSGDPASRWTWPEPKTFIEAFPHFATAFGGAAFGKGTALRVGAAGAALWLPPGTAPDEAALDALMERTADAGTAVDGPELMRQMASYHPEEPHWFLPLLGVDPAHQNQGVGSALLRYVTDRCDRDGTLAYLDSSNPRNIPLYQRHGFEILGRAQSGNSPVITPMLRRPRGRS